MIESESDFSILNFHTEWKSNFSENLASHFHCGRRGYNANSRSEVASENFISSSDHSLHSRRTAT